MLLESSVNLTSAENYSFDFLRFGNGGIWVRNDPLELRFASELLNARPSNRVTEERLGEEDDEGYKCVSNSVIY